MMIRVVITGRSYDLADSMPDSLELADGADVGDALAALKEHASFESALPSSCLIALGENHLGTIGSHQPRQLRDGDELVIIAPVAGG